MTSERAVRANRINALVSTGPRTQSGKARAGQNALKHGLSVQHVSSETNGETQRLAAALSEDEAHDTIVQDAARSLAEAQLHLQSVQRVKIATLNVIRELASVVHGQQTSADRARWHQVFDQIKKLERYERRALSRRKAATRRMDEISKIPSTNSSLGSYPHVA